MTIDDERLQTKTLSTNSPALDSVRTKRILAVIMDWVIVLALCVPVAIVIFLLGLATFGLGFLLYGAMFPAIALLYTGYTMGGPEQATIGMRLNDIHVEQFNGQPVDFVTAIAHAFLFWASMVIATPLVLAVSLFNADKRTLHDLLTGTIVRRGSFRREFGA